MEVSQRVLPRILKWLGSARRRNGAASVGMETKLMSAIGDVNAVSSRVCMDDIPPLVLVF